MKNLFLLIPFFLFCCSDDEVMTVIALTPVCEQETLEVISNGNSCDSVNNPFVCEVITIEERQFIDEHAYEWSPDICEFGLGDQIIFKNGSLTTSWDVVDQGHHIAQERINIACNDFYEHSAYICQENEVIYASFLNDLLGPDTLTLELRTMTLTYKDQRPGEKRNIINLYQDRTNSNIRNFWLRHFVGDGYYEQIWQTSHQTITLGGTEYKDVIEYSFGDHIHSEPDFRYYLQKGVGILGFEVEKRLWVRE